MFAARNLRPVRLSRRLAAPPEWIPKKPPALSNVARRAITTSPQPAQENWWGLIPAGLFASAAWNFFRARAKEKVRDYRQSRLELEEINGSTDICSYSEKLEFRRVVCEGVYDENNSVLVHKYLMLNSGKWINGYNLLTPLIPFPDDPQRYISADDSPVVLFPPRERPQLDKFTYFTQFFWSCFQTLAPQVLNSPLGNSTFLLLFRHSGSNGNRNVPLSCGNKALDLEPNSPPTSTAPGQKVKFVGVISKGERPNKLWRSNDAAKSEWYTVDIPSIARACGLPETTLHVVEIDLSENRNTRKPYPFALTRTEVKEVYTSQLEHACYSGLGFFNGCAALAYGLKKFGKV